MSDFNLDMSIIVEEAKTLFTKQRYSLSNYLQVLYRKAEHMVEDIKNLTEQFFVLRDTENYDLFLLLIKSLSTQYKTTSPDTLPQPYYGHQGSFCIDFVEEWTSC